MYISSIKIENYRTFKDVIFLFDSQMNIIVGDMKDLKAMCCYTSPDFNLAEINSIIMILEICIKPFVFL